MNESRILLAHGNGGRLMRELIAHIFARHLANPVLNTDADAVLLPGLAGEIMVTTDGFTVQPLEFPGGNLGSLAVHGVVNDLAVAGAEPRYLTLSAIIEEGLEVAVLDRLVASFARAAAESGVMVAAGDTKVVRRQEGGGLYLSVAGIGVKQARAAIVDAGHSARRCGAGIRSRRRPRRGGDAGARAVRPVRQARVRFRCGVAAGKSGLGQTGPALHARPHPRRACHRVS